MPVNVTMPALSPTMTEGNLAKWHKKEGDKIKAGEVIAEIETDKATMEVEAVDEGILGKILVPAGTQAVPVNKVIAILLEEGEKASDISAPQESAAPVKQQPSAAPAPAPQAAVAQVKQENIVQNKGNRVFASPLAKRIAAEKGINLANLQGSGPHGRIVKADVENAKGGSKIARPANIEPATYTEIPNNNIKRITAKRLLESKTTVPHFYLTIDCIIDSLLDARRQINDAANGEYKLSVNDFVIKAVGMALKSYPAANVQWTDAAVLQFNQADISVAVATPNGLITPIVRAAEHKGLREISEEVKDLAKRARDGKLKPEEFQGGTFTISNLGMFGIREFAAIINPPQSCILAVGAGIEMPVVVNGKIEIRTVMSCTLSTDHRSVDGAVGAEFLQHFKRYIENPVSMLV